MVICIFTYYLIRIKKAKTITPSRLSQLANLKNQTLYIVKKGKIAALDQQIVWTKKGTKKSVNFVL